MIFAAFGGIKDKFLQLLGGLKGPLLSLILEILSLGWQVEAPRQVEHPLPDGLHRPRIVHFRGEHLP